MTSHLENTIRRVSGLPIERAKAGYGSFLTFDLGCPVSNRPNRWEWHVWIYCCYWTLFRESDLIADYESSRDLIANLISTLAGESIQNIAIQPEGSSVIRFSNRWLLTTSPWEETAESWMIYTPEDFVLTLHSDKTWTFTHGNQSSTDTERHPITPTIDR